MALPSTGSISMAQVRTELGLSGAISLNTGAVRSLAGKASGAISMSDLRGKSAVELSNGVGVQWSYGGATHRGFALQNYTSSGNVARGSLSPATIKGRSVIAIAASSSDQSAISIFIDGTTDPGWTQIMLNGTIYAASSSSVGKNYGGTTANDCLVVASIPNVYSLLNTSFTIGVP